VPYACRVLLKLLVLIALAFSLGEVHDAMQVTEEVSFVEAEPEPQQETITAEWAGANAVPRHRGALPENFVLPPRSLDAGRVFRPPRLLAA
jgi:hypothetical protein